MKKWTLIAIISTLVSLFALPARAGCGYGCYSTPYRVVKEVVPVLAYPVLVPAFQFQYVPTALPTVPVVPVTGYPVATPIIQQPVIPTPFGQPIAPYGQPIAQPVGQQSFAQQIGQQPYNNQPYAQPPQNPLSSKDMIRELAKALLEEMNKMTDSNNSNNSTPPADNGPPAVPGSQLQQLPQVPQANLPQIATAAMARTCAQCHTGVGSKADMVIFTQPGLLNQQANWKKIKTEIESGRMPPKDVHFQLSAQERLSIIQWLTAIGVN